MFRREADRAKINQAIVLSQKKLSLMPSGSARGIRGRLLRQRIDQLQTVADLQTGNAELVQPASSPTVPSSPRPKRDAALAAALGLLLGIALAILIERLDRRLRDPKEVEEVIERPVLGAVPRSRVLSRGRVGNKPLPPGEAEAFRMLRANLRYFNVDRHLSSVLVTSAAPGDGKSTVAANLAFASAETGANVLLLEADLRHPTLASLLGLPSTPGLTNVLAGISTLEEVTQHAPVPGRSEDDRALDVVVSGPIPPNPSDLMESARLRDLIHEAEKQYDLVVIDTPPTSVVSDAIPLLNQTSGVIVVARLGKTTRDALAHLRTQLINLEAPTLGVVVNSLGRDSAGYGYGYAYGYYGKPESSSPNGQAPAAPVIDPGEVAPRSSDAGPESEPVASVPTATASEPASEPPDSGGSADNGPSQWSIGPPEGGSAGGGLSGFRRRMRSGRRNQ